jgi:hypothetical protein
MSGNFQTFAPQTRAFDLNRASINEDSRTVELDFSSETDRVERWFGVEILSHDESDVDLSRLRNKAPYLMDHDMRDQRGVVEMAAIDGQRGRATVRFSKSARGEELWQDVKDGIRTKVSVGYQVLSLTEVEKRSDGTPVYRVGWAPFELSSVSVAADDDVGIRSPESIFGQRAALLSTRIAMSKPTHQDKPEAIEDANRAVEPVEAKPAPEAKPETRAVEKSDSLSKAEVETLARQMAEQEIARQTEIRAIGESLGRDKSEVEKAIKDKLDVDAFRLQLFDALRAENKPFATARAEAPAVPDKGTIAETRAVWAKSAARALEARGIKVEIPDYSREAELPKRSVIGGEDARRPIHRSLVGSLTLADKVTIDAGIGSAIVNEVVVHAPEADVFPVDVFDGDTVTLSVETGTGSVGFRNANEGSPLYKGVFESRIFQAQVLDVPVQVDIQGVLRASKDPGRFLEAQTRNRLKAVIKHIGVQTWYAGTAQAGADAKSAPGLLAQSISGTTHVVDATGTTGKTSVYLVRLGTEDGASHLYGNGATITMGGEWDEETVEDAAGKKFRALVNFISGRLAPKLANKNALVRIKNVSAESNKTLTASLLRQAISLAQENDMEPNAIFMTPRSQLQLSASYDATLIGMGRISPLLNEFEGIPLYVTNSISNAETV